MHSSTLFPQKKVSSEHFSFTFNVLLFLLRHDFISAVSPPVFHYYTFYLQIVK